MGALDELLAHWRSNPDAERTVALCACLSYAQHPDLIREVGARAEIWHVRDGEVMLAVGRMYLDARLLAEAQVALVTASKAAITDARPLRYLGEVLLRLGDADRAEKVLARALQLASSEDTTRWHERASLYVALQRRVGSAAVAREVERSLPNEPSVPPPRDSAESGFELGTLEPPASVRPVGPPSVRPAGAALPPPRPPPLRKVSPAVPLPPRPAAASQLKPKPLVDSLAQTRAVGVAPLPPPAARVPLPAPAGPSALVASAPVAPSAQTNLRDTQDENDFAELILGPPESPSNGAAPNLPLGSSPRAAPPFGGGPALPDAFAAIPTFQGGPRDTPAPALVLEHLARVGVFEPGQSAPPAWERATRERPRGMWLFSIAIVLLIGALGGGVYYDQQAKQVRLARARELNSEVEQRLKTGDIARLKQTDGELSQSLELDSWNRDAALLWLRNRVLHALLSSGEARGIDGAIHRAKSLGLSEEQVAFGKIVAFYTEGDLVGATAMLPRWDSLAGRDPYYQLAAGVVLEAAGDPRAIERFEAARRLDKDFLVADLFLVRLALLELGLEKARPLLEDATRKLGDRPERKVLEALAWAVDDARPEVLPEAAVLPPARLSSLPAPLLLAAKYVEGVRALEARELPQATAAIAQALPLVRGPAMAAELGLLAIRAGDGALARRAALAAVRFNATYAPARVLAARVALLSGRIDEAENAVRDVDLAPDNEHLAVVRAVVAYEAFSITDLARALDPLTPETTDLDFAALSLAPRVLRGGQLPAGQALEELASSKAPWAEMVALDAALDMGDLKLSERILAAFEDRQEPAILVRRARLLRYRGKIDLAQKASQAALEAAPLARALLEHTYVLFAAERYRDADVLAKRHANALGALKPWIGAWYLARTKGRLPAQKALGELAAPLPDAPLALRTLAAQALAAARDPRAAQYITRLAREVPKHPDVLGSAEALLH